MTYSGWGQHTRGLISARNLYFWWSLRTFVFTRMPGESYVVDSGLCCVSVTCFDVHLTTFVC